MGDLHDDFEKEPDLAAQFEAEPEAHAAPKPPPEVGMAETFVNRSTDALPLGRPVVNAASAGLVHALRPGPGVHFTPQAQRELEAMGEHLPEEPGILDDYRDIRQTRAERTEAGSEQNPWVARAGTATGIGLSIAAPFMPKATIGKGVGVVNRLASGTATAGGYGALNGVVNGKADLSRGEVGQALNDAIGIDGIKAVIRDIGDGKYGQAGLDFLNSGALGGAGGGLVLGGLLEAFKNPLSKMLNRTAAAQGRRVLTNGADQLSNKNPVRDSAVHEAIDSGAMRPFSTTKGVLERLQDKTSAQAELYNQLVERLEGQGVTGPNAREIADRLVARGAFEEMNTGANKSIPNQFMKEAENVEAMAGPSPELRLTQAENIKRNLQKEARYGEFKETPMNEAKQEIASIFRKANEEAIESAAKRTGASPELRSLASQFVPVKQKLGNLIEAEKAATRGVARGATRQSGHMPSALETVVALGSGHPEAVLAKPGLNLLKNRGSSAIAAPARYAANGLQMPDAAARATRAIGLVSGGLDRALNDEKYGELLAEELKKGGTRAVMAIDYALQKRDPDYAARRAADGGSP